MSFWPPIWHVSGDIWRHVATFGDIWLICLLKREDICHVLKTCRDMSKTYPTKSSAISHPIMHDFLQHMLTAESAHTRNKHGLPLWRLPTSTIEPTSDPVVPSCLSDGAASQNHRWPLRPWGLLFLTHTPFGNIHNRTSVCYFHHHQLTDQCRASLECWWI